MAGDTFLSDRNAWVEISVLWSAYSICADAIKKLQQANTALLAAPDVVAGLADVQKPALVGKVFMAGKIDILLERRNKIVNFCDMVHYEAAETFDIPFAEGMSNALEMAYALNPGSMERGDGQAGTLSLAAAMRPVLRDSALAADFNSRVDALDHDEISADIAAEIRDTRYWAREFEIIELIRQAEEEILGGDVWWKFLSEEEKIKRLKEFAEEVWRILGLPGELEIEYFAQEEHPDWGGYVHPSNKCRINLSDSLYGDTSTAQFSGGAIVHELRHLYQYSQMDKENPDAPSDTVKGWNEKRDDKYEEDYWRHPRETDARAMQLLAGEGYPEL